MTRCARRKRSSFAKLVTLEIEIAGRLLPWLGGSLTSAALTLDTGLDGFAGRVGDRIEGEFPGTMLGTGRGAVQGVQVVVGELGLPPIELSKLRTDHGAVFYRFRSVHLAQVRSDEEPVFVHRGGRVVGYSDVTGGGVRAFAERVAGHLMTRERDGLRGTYLALVDRYEGGEADARERATAAYALAVFAGVQRLDAEMRGDALRGARRILDGLGAEGAPDQRAVERAAWLIAHVFTSVGEQRERGGLDEAAAVVGMLMELSGDEERWGEVDSGERSMIAYALALAGVYSDDSAVRERADRVVRGQMREAGTADLAAHMPWLCWAAMTVAGDGEIPAGAALRQLRELCARNEVVAGAGEDDAALAGGIRFTRGRGGRVDWQSLRVFAALGTMLGDTRLTGHDEISREVAAIRRQLRFALQLEAGREEMRMYPAPETARGGVRAAVWDQRMTLDAASLALITACETIRSLEGRSGP